MSSEPARRHLLIAVDLGSASTRVAHEGFALARDLGAEPMLIYAYAFPSPSPASFYPRASRAIYEQAMDDLRRLAHDFDPSIRDDQLLARSGAPARSIVDAAREFNAVLIVMGTQRLRRIERLLVASIAVAVTCHAPCPVLVIPCIRMAALASTAITTA
jgi:nucleotide-binding universal stress UspA family protein